jgi:hypothetical protein
MPAPTVTQVQNDSGPEVGATPVLIFGADFTNPLVTQVTFGGVVSNFTVDQDDLITAVSPPGTGSVDIEVTNADGTTVAGSFQYLPIVADVVFLAPGSGSVQGGTAVTLTGSGFLPVTQVNFGGTPALSFAINSDTEIVATSPPGQGVVEVGVVTAAGDSSTEPFTYLPMVTGVNPPNGPQAGGDAVTVSGQGFDNGAFSVVFDTAGAGFRLISDSEIEAVTPGGQGDVHVTVSTVDGTSPATQDDVFSYDP